MAVTNEFNLKLAPLEASDLPSEEVIIAAAQRLVESTVSWKPGRTYHKNKVRTFHHRDNNGASWHCRVSEHPQEEATFNQFWEKLGKDKANNEQKFIPDIQQVKKIKDISSTASIWMLKYVFTPPISPRVFTVLQVFHLTEAEPTRRKGVIISIPINPASIDDEETQKFHAKTIHGRYVSVERILELESGTTEWRMATCSTPGGLIPRFLAESTIPSKIAQDVPHFMKWLRSLHSET